jgi:hypothetical protein
VAEKIEHSKVRHIYLLRHGPESVCSDTSGTAKYFDNNLPEGTVQWSICEVDPHKKIINTIFDDLLGTENMLGKNLETVMTLFNKKMLPRKHREQIEKIRQTLRTNPRIIMLQNTNQQEKEEYTIYDGWHTATAFAIEKKNIPAIIGRKDAFDCYKRV